MAVPLANSRASRLCADLFDPLSAPCGSHEWIRKVLCFPRNLVAPELHDAHGVGRLAVICQDEFGDPKITATNNSLDSKPLFARLTSALALYIASTAGSLAGLRVVQHRVLVIDEVLRLKIVGVGGRPMLIQCRTDLLISRSRTLLLHLLIVHLEPPIPLLPPSSRSRFHTGLLIPPVERREISRIPCLAESRSAQIPVRTDFPRHGAQVVPKIDDRRPTPEPVAVIDAVDREARLEHERVWDHRVVLGIGVFLDVEVLLNLPLRVGEEGPLGADRRTELLKSMMIV